MTLPDRKDGRTGHRNRYEDFGMKDYLHGGNHG